MLKHFILVLYLVMTTLFYACAEIGERDNPFDPDGVRCHGSVLDWNSPGNDGDIVQCKSNYYKYDEVEANWIGANALDVLDVLGACTTKRVGEMQRSIEEKGQIRIDTLYYMCAANHSWTLVEDFVVKNIIGIDCDSDGNLVMGRINKDTYFVCDKGIWRVAMAVEMEFGGACTEARQGLFTNDSTLICDNESFRNSNIYDFDVGAKDYFNPDIEYGKLEDERDGRSYKTVVINGITVMAENLNYADENEYSSLVDNNWCFNNDSLNCLKGGRYYTWFAAMDIDHSWRGTIKNPHQGICPKGWHIPTYEEWIMLFNNVHYTAQKAISDNVWLDATNESGFSALPVGFFSGKINYNFLDRFQSAHFWSVAEANYDYAYSMYIGVEEAGFVDYNKNSGISIRCFLDKPASTE